MTTASEALAQFLGALDIDRVEPALVSKAKDHLLDTIGVACAGIGQPQARATTALVQHWGGVPEAGVIGLRLRLPAPKAAFVNALHARIHTFDDTHEIGPVHPGSAVVAAALCVAETAVISGRALLAALIAGYEAATRLSMALGARHYATGFQTTGTCAPFGAVAAAARARGLDAARTMAAIGLAGQAAIGLRQYQVDGSMLDTALAGARGAEAGVAAVEMASRGLAGAGGILDGRWGMLRVMSGEAPERLAADLGKRWEFAATAIKPYASCRFTHGPIAALKAAKLDHRQVEAVEIATFRASFEVSDRPRPRDRAEAILSHQVAAALALHGRPILPSDFDALDGDVLALSKRVSVRHDPELDAAYPACWPHRIVVSMKGGARLMLDSAQPPSADRSATLAKFRALAAPVLGASNAERMITLVAEMESLVNPRPLLRLLSTERAEAA